MLDFFRNSHIGLVYNALADRYKLSRNSIRKCVQRQNVTPLHIRGTAIIKWEDVFKLDKKYLK